MSMSLEEVFVRSYRREYDFFDKAGRLAAALIEKKLHSAGIKSLVTSRAKSPGSLEAKLRKRRPRQGYETTEKIYESIVDLTGIRIALYFPGQQELVREVIAELFDIREEKQFPEPRPPPESEDGGQPAPVYVKKFGGYRARHYRVRTKISHLGESERRYAEARIEIQVASVLMHAWSEVEHDLIYKPYEGTLSEDEHAILDELNGLVLTGEIALERLEKAGTARVESQTNLSNHFELATYLLDRFSVTRQRLSDLGSVDLLFDLIEALNLASLESIQAYVDGVFKLDIEDRPISEQIIDQILSEDEHRYDTYQSVRKAYDNRTGHHTTEGESDFTSALGLFMGEWIAYEKTVRETLLHTAKKGPPVPTPQALEASGLISSTTASRLDPIRLLRNQVIHGGYKGSPSQLRQSAKQLKTITDEFRKSSP